MLEFRSGNLLEADADALVNTVNCVGVMGKGIALQFKQAFPENFRAYASACQRGEVVLGQMFVVPTGELTPPRFLVNFPTKGHWKAKSRLADIRSGLEALVQVVQAHSISSIAIPPLGCGNGGLDWNDVYPLIEKAFSDLPHVRVLVFAPQSTPPAEAMPVATRRPRMTRGRALMVKLISHYSQPGYQLTKIEIQKLAYFLQEAGEPLRLSFVKHTYGPYAEALNHVMQDMEGHLTRGFGDRAGESSVQLLPGAVEEADRFLTDDAGALDRLRRVAELISGFENPYGMELLATIHWVGKNDAQVAAEISRITSEVQAWNARKKRVFQPEHIKKGWQRLLSTGWLARA